MITVSIVVPIYNTIKDLKRLIDSLVNQTYRQLEIILVDDGSTDKSGEYCEQRKLEDSRIVVIHQENGGETTARNAGLAIATGDYVSFCDSDDELPITAIEDLINGMVTEVDLVIGSYLVCEDDASRLACALRKSYTVSEVAFDVLTDSADYRTVFIMYACNGKLYKMSIIKEYGIHFLEKYNLEACAEFVIDYLQHCSGKITNIFTYTYIYYRYSTERIQGLQYFYPDKFEYLNNITTRYSELIQSSELNEKVKPILYQKHMNTIISELVHAVAYEEYFTEISINIESLLNTRLIRFCISSYKRKQLTDSRLVPFFIKHRKIKPLLYLLRQRGKKYIRITGKQTSVRMIYRKNNKTL